MTKEQLYFELIPAIRSMLAGDYPNMAGFTEKDSLKDFPGSKSEFGSWRKKYPNSTSYFVEERSDTFRMLDEIRVFLKSLSIKQRNFPVWIFVQDQGLVNLVGLPDISIQTSDKKLKEDTWNQLLGRLAFKVVLVTGGAQGFGEGIARSAFKQGAHVIIADLNREKGEQLAMQFNKKEKPNRMIFVHADISQSGSVQNLMQETVKAFGGLDVLISNAGVLRAGGLEELNEVDFDLVTKINYKGFYLCSKYASRIMKAQNRENKSLFSDIIQINSKSGLQGSNRNFAYAGSKFGGIGLVQSLALELIEYRIKVNAVCPGNFFEGPLWSDPQHGLFVQYLKAGKVKGAKTIDDVKSFYENLVPMKRGVSVEDVMKAVYYAIEQKYETGQSLPVTGGQIMK